MPPTRLEPRPGLSHPWAVDARTAEGIQRLLAPLVRLEPLPADGERAPRFAAGVDIAYAKHGGGAWAAAVLMDRDLRVVESRVVRGVPDVPYARGYLAFREGRLTIAALTALSRAPDLVFCDGHGVVHERGLGLASHVGVLLDIPTIGVPKTPFHSVEREPGRERGSYYVLTKEWGAEGASIRLRAGTKPVYVSPGHLVDLKSAVDLALAWSTGRHRVPEPLAAAHTLATTTRSDAEPPRDVSAR